MILFSVWKIIGTVFARFIEFLAKPKLRVRTIDMRNGKYVFGTVEKTVQVPRPYAHDPITYWTVVWDDTPGVWNTIPSMNFVWYDNFWTLVERT